MATVTAPPERPLGPTGAIRAPGARLGRYELVVPLASGGMAEIWVARQLGDFGFARLVALKLMRPELANDPKFHAMFLEEARIAARIRDRHVVAIHDLGEVDGVVFHALELIEGAALSTLVRRAQPEGIPRPIAIRVVLDLLSGLHAAHELRDVDGTALAVIHRDVSPQNVLIGRDGEAKVSDFGIAKVMGRLTVETDQGQFKGKYTYCSPEQLARGTLDRRTDVCSAGIVLWELLANKRLFQRSDLVSTIEAVREWQIPPLPTTVPAAIADACMKALAASPDERFGSAEDFARELERAGSLTADLADRGAVQALLVRLAGEDIERRSAEVKDAITHLTPPPVTEIHIETQAPVHGPPSAAADGRRSKWPLVTTLLLVTGGAITAGAIAVTRHEAPAVAETAPSAASSARTPTPETSEGAPSAAASVAPPPSLSTAHAPPRVSVTRPTTTHSPSARPSAQASTALPFNNPY